MSLDNIISHLFEGLNNLSDKNWTSVEFLTWKRRVEAYLERLYGENSLHVKYFKNINFPDRNDISKSEEELEEQYQFSLNLSRWFLSDLGYENYLFTEYEYEKRMMLDQKSNHGNNLCGCTKCKILKICNRFDQIVRSLSKKRYNNRETITVNDEYDVQDILYALLQLEFDDVRKEEWTPSYAGKTSRMDFLFKKDKIVLEVKKTRDTLKGGQIADQLIIDSDRYKVHQDCRTLICFVYDPEHLIENPKGIETDLSGNKDKLKIIVLISPQ